MSALDELLAWAARPWRPPLDTTRHLAPWSSPGRVSLAPALAHTDRLTWHAATYVAVNPTANLGRLTVNGVLLAYLIEHQRTYWQVPDDPFIPSAWWEV